jgi:hypothetical protein
LAIFYIRVLDKMPAKVELWGTFSVRDHLRKRAFVAEVLAYDRLVIPRPPTEDEEESKPGEETQFRRWRRNKWNPGRLNRFLELLREKQLAIDLPWAGQARKDWEELYHGSDATKIGVGRATFTDRARTEVEWAKTVDPAQASYIATGGLIHSYVAGTVQNEVVQGFVRQVKASGAQIEPVIAYTSYRQLQKEQNIEPVERGTPPETLIPFALFGWDFYVPEDKDKSDYEMLWDAVQFASRSDLREQRQAFQGWLKEMHEGNADVKEAAEQMGKLLNDYQRIVRDSGVNTVIRYAAKAAPVLGKPLLHLLGLPHWEEAVADVLTGAVPLTIEPLLPKTELPPGVLPAAFIVAARRFLKKR